jgi:hypothetical protein
VLEGRFPVISHEEFDAENERIWALFEGGPLFPDEGR